MKRRWLRLMLIIPAAAILLLLLGVSLLHTPPARRFIFERARASLLNRFAIDIQAAAFRFNLFTSEVTIEDLTARSASTPDLPPLFHADRIYLKPELFSILKGSWDFEELQITAPRIRYFIGQDGKDNLPKARSASNLAPEFLIAHAEAQNGSFQFEDLRNKFSLTFPQWQLRMDGKRGTLEHKIDVSILRPAFLQYQAQTIPIEQFTLSGVLRRNTFRADTVYLRAGDSQLSLTGNIRGFSRPQIDVQLKPDLNLRDVARILNPSDTFEGNLAGTIQLSGPSDKLQISARLQGTNIRALTYRKANFNLSSRAEWDPGRLRLRRVEMNSPDGSLSGSAEFFAESGLGTNTIEAEIRDFNVSPVWKLLRPPFDLASRATGRFFPEMEWRIRSIENFREPRA